MHKRKICLRCVASFVTVVSLSGCMSYDRQPLNVEAYRTEWMSRLANSTEVLEFARQLDALSEIPQEFDPNDGVSLNEAIIIALVFNTDLCIARAKLRVAEAAADNAGLWDDPVLGFDVLHITDNVPDPWIATTGLSFTLPLSGRPGIEKQLAKSEQSAAFREAIVAEHNVIFEVKEAWIRWSANQIHSQTTEELIARFESMLQGLDQLVEAGEFDLLEARLFRVDKANLYDELIEIQRQIDTDEYQLKSLLGLAPHAPVQFVAELTLPLPDDVTMAVLAEVNPLLSVKRAEYEAAEDRLQLELRKQYPDISIGPQHENDEGQSRIGFVFGIPIPILNANKSGIATALASRDVARIEYESTYQEAMNAFIRAQQRLESLRTQREHIETSIVPLVDAQLEDGRRLFEIGETTPLIILESLQRSHHAKRQLVDVKAKTSHAINEIHHLFGTGASFITSSTHMQGGDE